MNIVLCGFMGCGKSTVGRQLADRLGLTFVDMDTYIEQADGRTVSTIFADEGEEYFRRLEHHACRALSDKRDLVIATGGGAVLREENVEALRRGGVLIWLKVDADCVLERLKDDTSRPLLQRPDKERAVRELLEFRAPFYAVADITVDANAKASTVITRILDAISAIRI